MKRAARYLLLLPLVFTACKSSSGAADPVVTTHHEEELNGNFISVSQEMYDNTLAEVKLFVEKLNLIIKNKDYEGWKNALSDEFFERISSPEFLESASQSVLLRSKKIVLKTPDDYFLYVVVPARSNSRVDEIEFIASNAVKVFYVETFDKKNNSNNLITTEVRRLRLYELIKKSGDTWKIID
jgi:hypothetical protein